MRSLLRASAHRTKSADDILVAIAETPDITLVELQKKLQARGVSAGIGALWRFFDRRRITFKKRMARPVCK
jgi:transposase